MAGAEAGAAAAGRIPAAWSLFGFSRTEAIGFAVLLAAIIVAPGVIYPIFVMKVLCFALFACAFNLLVGYAGLLSFGHAAYFGIGSYVAAWLVRYAGFDSGAAILTGGLAGGLLGLAFGTISIRRSGLQFAMITLALGQLVYFFCVEAPFTHGENGIQQVPRGRLFGLVDLHTDMAMYWVTAGIFLIFFLIIHRAIHSPFGQVLKAIRESEPRATSLGYSTDRYKLLAFVLSCAISGIAGATMAIVFGIATLTDVHFSMSGEVVLMTLVGGMGTIFGPIIGALVVVGIETYLAQFGDWVMISQGIVFVICVLVFRRGIVGEIAGRLRLSL